MAKRPLNPTLLQKLMSSKAAPKKKTAVRPCELAWNRLTRDQLGFVKDVVADAARRRNCTPHDMCVVAHLEGDELALVHVYRKDSYGKKKKKSWIRSICARFAKT